jgi:hypothetical protein
MRTNKKDELENNDLGLIIFSVIVLLIIISLWLATYFKLKDLDPVKRGTFGDMFGSINALFSGLALAGIILTILLQKKELALQRQELKDTREELKRAADAQENSERALRRQAENLKISAKLTALNTLVTYYTDLEKNHINNSIGNGIQEVVIKKDQYLKRIEDILERKENS